MLKKLVLEDFKSFKGRNVIPLLPGITAIIGQNGSGKSNIIDGILFVLGTKSQSIRAEKAENVIFNGGNGNKPSEYALVELVLENKNGIFNEFLDGQNMDEIVIGRKVTRSSNTYKFNGKNCNRELIERILAKAEIDTSGFNMLKQDEVTKVIKMTPKERRTIIDKISGIADYDEKKEKALKDLAEVEIKLRENEAVLKEKESTVLRLKKEKEAAEKFLELQKTKEELELALKAKEKLDLEEKIKELQKKRTELLSKNSHFENEINVVNKKVKELEGKLNSLEKELISRYSGVSEIEKIKENIFEREKRIGSKIAEIKALEAYIEDMKSLGEYSSNLFKELKQFQGVYGPLGTLFSTDEKFSVAIQIALGNRINNIVVENKDVALQCIDFLKKHNLGRATFLPLNDLMIGKKSPESENALGMRGVIDYASNLIVCEKKFMKAFHYVLHDTLVVEDHGVFKNLRNVRAVSLEGDLIAKGGEITGGKKPDIKLMPNISEKIKKLEDLRIELLEEERELEELKKLLKEKESKKGDLSEIENIRMILINEKTKKESLETENIAIKIELGKVEREIESLTNTLKEFTKENHQNESFDKKILEMSINQIKRKREEALRLMNELGYVNLLAIEEFERFNKEYQELKSKIEKIKEEILEINKLIEEIEETKREKFFKVLYELSSKFDQTFKKIFGGGEAKLELENFDDLNSGLIIKAHPSNKKPHTIDSLSGGEKTLTAVAFIFAIQEMKKSPFYLLDEIDAALDKNNSYKIAQLLKEYSKSTQIIVVSHNEEVVKNADRIYGVSIRNGISRLRSIVLEDEAKLEAELKAN